MAELHAGYHPDREDEDDQQPIPDLSKVRQTDLPKHEGDPALKATLERLQHEAEQPREAVSGFASAI